MNSKILNFITGVICLFSVSGLYSCKNTTPTPEDTRYIKDFHVANFLHSANMLEEGKLALYVDYSTCIAEGMKTSAFYVKLVPSFVEATKTFYSIKGDSIKQEIPADTYNRLLNIHEVNYADLKYAAEQIAKGNTEAALLTDGEYYNPTMAGANPNNPYLADAFKTWMKKGHDIFIISEPYIETNNGLQYNKKRFYFLFTDTRLKNNIYDRIAQTASLEQFPNGQIFHLSADHPNIMAEGNSSQTNDLLAAKTANPLSNGDYVIKGLRVDRNSFGGYKITDVDVKVYDMNMAYMDYYMQKESGEKTGALGEELPECPNFIVIDHKEFERHGMINLYFDIVNYNNAFLVGKPNNYFKIDFFITKTENVFSKYSSMFTFDLLGHPGITNSSVVTSVEQCLVDKDLENQMKHSPFYTIYVKSNKY